MHSLQVPVITCPAGDAICKFCALGTLQYLKFMNYSIFVTGFSASINFCIEANQVLILWTFMNHSSGFMVGTTK